MNLFLNPYTTGNADRDEELARCMRDNHGSALFDRIITIPGRPTFNDFFVRLGQYPHDVNIIANADIRFDHTIRHAQAIGAHEVWALTRWEWKGEEWRNYEYRDSQDVWVFRGTPHTIQGADFTQGVPGCDGRIAWLLNACGYEVTNPSRSVKTYHEHAIPVRTYYVGGMGKPRSGKPCTVARLSGLRMPITPTYL